MVSMVSSLKKPEFNTENRLFCDFRDFMFSDFLLLAYTAQQSDDFPGDIEIALICVDNYRIIGSVFRL